MINPSNNIRKIPINEKVHDDFVNTSFIASTYRLLSDTAGRSEDTRFGFETSQYGCTL